jgi:cyclomaltodextrinase / maltogenic alpha-amylase / neopullulanase
MIARLRKVGWSLGLLVATALAHDGRTPELALTVGRDWTGRAADLALPGLDGLDAGAAPPGLEVEIRETVLRLRAGEVIPWGLLPGRDGDLLLRTTPERLVTLKWTGPPGASVFVFGSFNGWNRGTLALDEAEPGRYRIQLPLPPGDHQYLLQVDGAERRDPANPDSVGNGFGGWNSRLRVADEGLEPLRVWRLGWRSSGAAEREAQFLVPDRPREAAAIALHGNRALPASAMDWRGDTLCVRFPAGEPALGPALLRVAVHGAGRAAPLQTLFLDSAWRWEDATIYALMPDRFRNGDPGNDAPIGHPELLPPANFQGGDLAGLLRTIEEGYFDSLGVSALWIFPLNATSNRAWREYPAPHRWYSGYHGYWPVHPTRIEPRFGDEELFKRLTAAARQRDLRVLLDLVANHVHEEHPWTQEHPGWFGRLELEDGRLNLRLWDEHRLTTWFEPYMPDIDYEASAEAVEAMSDVAVDWLLRYELDGFRHDAVKHVPRRFWERLTEKLQALELERPLYQIGETFGSDELIASYVGPAALDAQFNFNLYHPAIEIFLSPERGFGELGRLIEQNLAVYGPNHRMGNLMDSHDKPRYAGYADGDFPLSGVDLAELGWSDPPQVDHEETYERLALYLGYLAGLPGLPVLYYGDEIGLTGAADPDNRRMMRFGAELIPAERRLLERVRELFTLRQARPELRRGDFQLLQAGHETIAWLRSAETEDGRPSRTLVVLNKAEEPRALSLELPLGLGRIDWLLAAREARLEPVEN